MSIHVGYGYLTQGIRKFRQCDEALSSHLANIFVPMVNEWTSWLIYWDTSALADPTKITDMRAQHLTLALTLTFPQPFI